MGKREVATIRWSQIPPNQWIRIVIPKPAECVPIIIPRVGVFIGYTAYFKNPYIKDRKLFTLVFPKDKFDRATSAIDPAKRQPTGPIEFEFLKSGRSLAIRNWKSYTKM
jgi:hypothetical protein